jgi:hypothetical protein
MESTGKITRSKAGGRKDPDPTPTIIPTHIDSPSDETQNDQVEINETPESEGGEDVSLDLIVKNPSNALLPLT